LSRLRGGLRGRGGLLGMGVGGRGVVGELINCIQELSTREGIIKTVSAILSYIDDYLNLSTLVLIINNK